MTAYELVDFYKYNQEKNMLSLNWKNVAGALVSAVLVALIGYLLSVGDVWKLDFHSIVNIAIMTAGASLLKALGTTDSNNFLGVVSVPPKS